MHWFCQFKEEKAKLKGIAFTGRLLK